MGSSIDLKKWREESLLHKLIYDWILVPLGIIAIICIVIIVNQIFRVSIIFDKEDFSYLNALIIVFIIFYYYYYYFYFFLLLLLFFIIIIIIIYY